MSSAASAWSIAAARVALLLEPGARPPVERSDQASLLGPQACTKHVREQVVVAVPAPTIIERDDEQVCALERLERALAVVSAGHGVAQGVR